MAPLPMSISGRWTTRDNPKPRQKAGLLTVIGAQTQAHIAAEKDAALERAKSKEAINDLSKIADAFKAATTEFKTLADSLPKKFKSDLEAIQQKYDERKKEFAANEKKSRDLLTQVDDEKNKADREKRFLQNQLDETTNELGRVRDKVAEKRDAFEFDEPQGHIKRRLPDNIVEIDLGSTAHVQAGLTFTILPSDYPTQGRQSRMKTVRVPNERGEYKSVTRFIEKGTIEVIEVLGPDLSRARITSESDYIRDGVARATCSTTRFGGRGQPTTSRSLAFSTSTAMARTIRSMLFAISPAWES